MEYEYEYVTNGTSTGYPDRDFREKINEYAADGWRVVNCGPPAPMHANPPWWVLFERRVETGR